jgi:hypothetical protein
MFSPFLEPLPCARHWGRRGGEEEETSVSSPGGLTESHSVKVRKKIHHLLPAVGSARKDLRFIYFGAGD